MTVTTPPIASVEELRQLVAQLSQAVEAYAQGHTDSTNQIVRHCHVLHHRAEPPEVFAERLRYQPLTICALMIAVEGGMLHALASRPGQVCSADQLAHWTHRPRNDIVRALRLLTAVGVCDEAGPQSYRANDKTSVLATKGQIGGLRVSSVPVSGIIPKIEEYFTNRATSTQSAAALASPYAYTYGKPMYDVLREDKEKKTAFDDYMEGRKQERKRRWHHTYPTMSELAAAGALTDSTPITIVDVGGNRGHDLETFVESNPEYQGRLILQDLPETVDPIRGETHSFEPMPYDFFTPQPVQGATIYLLLAVLHNWDDDACRAILKNLAAAMKPGYSRLLISGVLLPEVGAERRLADLDMQMWVLQLAQQRTRSELEALVGAVGLEIRKVWDNGDRESIIEVYLPEKTDSWAM